MTTPLSHPSHKVFSSQLPTVGSAAAPRTAVASPATAAPAGWQQSLGKGYSLQHLSGGGARALQFATQPTAAGATVVNIDVDDDDDDDDDFGALLSLSDAELRAGKRVSTQQQQQHGYPHSTPTSTPPLPRWQRSAAWVTALRALDCPGDAWSTSHPSEWPSTPALLPSGHFRVHNVRSILDHRSPTLTGIPHLLLQIAWLSVSETDAMAQVGRFARAVCESSFHGGIAGSVVHSGRISESLIVNGSRTPAAAFLLRPAHGSNCVSSYACTLFIFAAGARPLWLHDRHHHAVSCG